LNCSDIAELAALHFSGELDPPHATAFAAHLEACPSCARQIRQQADLDARLYEALVREEIDATALGRSVRERIAREPRGLRYGRLARGGFWQPAAALLLVITAAGYRSVIAARAGRFTRMPPKTTRMKWSRARAEPGFLVRRRSGRCTESWSACGGRSQSRAARL